MLNSQPAAHTQGVTRSFDLAAQQRFGRLSGDLNPMHLDRLAARRLSMGLAVHGVHALLWALDTACAERGTAGALKRVSVTFQRPIRIGETVEAIVRPSEDNTSVIELKVRDRRHVRVSVEWSDLSLKVWAPADEVPTVGPPRDLDFTAACLQQGSVPLMADREEASRLFPHLVRSTPLAQLAFFLAVTRVVGMECPGLHSVLAGIEAQFDTDPSVGGEALTYRVEAADERFSLLKIAVASGGGTGVIKAIVRPKPIGQPSIEQVAGQVEALRFCGVRALIVGGSRGLGELAAKIIVAGGGAVCLTYRDGQGDAARVVDELVAFGGEAVQAPLDVLVEAALPAAVLDLRPNALLYFASPMIELSEKTFDTRLFDCFIAFYVTGLARLVEQLGAAKVSPLTLWYPSTVFLSDPAPGTREYIAAKAAGESLCAYLERYSRGVTSIVQRLPRLLSDQTAGVGDLPSQREHIALMAKALAGLAQEHSHSEPAPALPAGPSPTG